MMLSADFERALTERLGALDADEGGGELAQPLVDAIARAMKTIPPGDRRPGVLCPAPLRRHLRRLSERALPHLVVLSYVELPPDVSVRAVATVEDLRAAQTV
jgi:flagellar biosynthesis component FlhA